jgi:plasmid stabilization system protein ParE
MAYKIEFTSNAQKNIAHILAWYYESDPRFAQTWHKTFNEKVKSLENYPARCPLVNERIDVPFAIRHLLFGKGNGTFRIVFAIKENRIVIYHVRRCSQEDIKEVPE